MNIYVGHSRNYDYENELYKVIRSDAELAKYNIIFPHENGNAGENTREFYSSIDLFICEATYASTGLGIELGWAYDSCVPIYCVHKKGEKISGSIYAVTKNIFEYSSSDELIKTFKEIINKESNK